MFAATSGAARIYMRFLYRNGCLPLENIWRLVPRIRRPRSTDCVSQGAIHMTDLIMLALGLGFFALSIGYAYACERL
jgi:hypothetical protein